MSSEFDPRIEQTLAQVLARRVQRCGDKPWIVTDRGTLSYRQIDLSSDRLARGLAAIGVRGGETVLVMLPDCPAILLSWCALAKLGAIEVPVNPHLRGAVLSHVINDSLATTLIVDRRLLDRIESVAAHLVHLERVILHGDDERAGARENRAALPGRFEQLDFARIDRRCETPLPAQPRYRDLMAVMYTSGTTGPAKGVMTTHAHAYEYALSVVELLELCERDVYYNPLPLFHIAGQWAAVYACCIVGATVVIPPVFTLGGFWADVRRHGATCTFLLGAMANWLYRQPASSVDADNPMQRMLVVPLLSEVEDFKRRFGCLVSTTWGSTEINVPTRSGFDLANNRTCGQVAEDRYEVRIVDEDDVEQPPNVPGEALVRAREPWILMAGYWNNPKGTVATWRNQWVHSGDILMRDEAGNLYFVDRSAGANSHDPRQPRGHQGVL